MKKREALHVVTKLGLEVRKGKEIFFKLVHDDRVILTTAVPKGKGEFRIEDRFRNQLLLTKEQFRDAIRCPFKRKHYLAHLERLGRI